MDDQSVSVRIYRFLCPSCGMTEQEMGHLTPEEELHCLLCLIEEQRHVRLRRWVEEEAAPTAAGPPPD